MKNIKIDLILEVEDDVKSEDIVLKRHGNVDGFIVIRNGIDIESNFKIIDGHVIKCIETKGCYKVLKDHKM